MGSAIVSTTTSINHEATESSTPSINDSFELNVKDSLYGAMGDGVTDDTAAIAAAIAADTASLEWGDIEVVNP